jgi:phenol/toluene 2-monooxygenase (NADH) P5/A5
MAYKILFRTLGKEIVVQEGQTILEAALAQGINWPYGCAHGMCGACKAQLISGEVDLSDASAFALFDDEREEGLILTCCARPKSDAVLVLPSEADPVDDPAD